MQAAKWPFLSSLRNKHLVERIMALVENGAAAQNEKDMMGTVRRSATKPSLKRFSSEAITDKELLVLGILCLYRFDALYIPIEDITSRADEWMHSIVSVLRRPGDMAIPLSSLRTFSHGSNWMILQQPGDMYYENARYWITMSV